MRVCTLTSALLILASIAGGQPQPDFDPKDVVRHEGHAGQRGVSPTEAHPACNSPTPSTRQVASALDEGQFMLDTSVTAVPIGNTHTPAAAFDGANFLVVWADLRNGSDVNIYGARVTQVGLLLDTLGLAISTAANNQSSTGIAYDGVNFLVVWSDLRDGVQADIYGARVARNGVVLDTIGFPISAASAGQFNPAVCYDGQHFLVVWEDLRNGSYRDIYGARVTPTGVVLDPAGIAICRAGSDQYLPAVASDGTNSFVVWQDDRNGSESDIYGARVSREGVLLDSSGIPVSTATNNQYAPAVAQDGSNFFVVWQDMRTHPYDIFGARVSPAGALLDSSGIAVATGASGKEDPAVACDGAEFLVDWLDSRGGSSGAVYGARVMPTGVVLDTEGIAISAAVDFDTHPAACSDGTNFLVAWDGPITACARISPTGTVIDTAGITLSTSGNEQQYPVVSFDGANFLAVWQDNRSNSGWDIYGARVSPTGIVLDPAGFAISTATRDQQNPAVAFDGTDFLVVWDDNRSSSTGDIYGARVTRDGVVLDPSGIPISRAVDDQSTPVIGYDSTNCLVVWRDHRSRSHYDIYGARVTRTGVVLDTAGIAISTTTPDKAEPTLCFDGANYLVVWSDEDVWGARVTPQGTVLDPHGFHISSPWNGEWTPAVGYDGTNYLVAWRDYYRSDPYEDIYGARVTTDGNVLDPSGIPILAGVQSQFDPAVIPDGAGFLVVWDYDRRPTGTASVGYSDIYGAHVTSSGLVGDTFPIVTEIGNQVYPALAQGQGNQMLLVYQGWTNMANGRTYNADHIYGKFGPFLGIQETRNAEVLSTSSLPTIVRGVIQVDSKQNTEHRSGAELLDISGRKVMDLHPGANDVSHLSPGVYFATNAAGRGTVQKFLIIR